MSQFLIFSQRTGLFLLLIVFISSFQLSQAKSKDHNHLNADNRESADEEQQQRRADDLKRLRNFLLKTDAKQLAARREKGNFLKRKLIREYLESVNDPDPNRLIEMQKRYKTFCRSSEDILDPDQAVCG